MTEGKQTMTRQLRQTHRRVMGWTLFFTNLFAALTVAGGWLLWQLQRYAGGWQALPHTDFTAIHLNMLQQGQLWLSLSARGLETVEQNVTQSVLVFLAGLVVFRLLQGFVKLLADTVWQSAFRSHTERLSQLAQETQREAKRTAVPPQMDDLQDAIDHMDPTESVRLHTGDPALQGLETAINELLDRMQAAYDQQSRFVSDASHELRTPIAVLKGYADLLERWGKDDPQVRDEAIAAIRAETQRMNRLVEQLLFLARGDSGRLQLKRAPTDLAALLEEVLEEAKMIHPDYRWQLQTVPLSAEADRDLLKQALWILVDNAVKYSPEGGEILLRAAPDSRGRPTLSVRDEGIGIRPEDAPRVFDRFFRSDPARSRRSGGAGLGLSIAQWIVTGHGGTIEVYSWEGIGSRFTVTL